MKKILISACLFLTSCSHNYYLPATSDNTATVSFANLSPENPEINIIDNCISKEIKRMHIERRSPIKKAKYKIRIPAERKISFNYRYFWVSGEKTTLVTSGNVNIGFGSIPNIKSATSKEILTCDERVTFRPEKDKHYEIYFGVDTNKCVIKANEALYDKFKKKNKLYAIKILNNQKC